MLLEYIYIIHFFNYFFLNLIYFHYLHNFNKCFVMISNSLAMNFFKIY